MNAQLAYEQRCRDHAVELADAARQCLKALPALTGTLSREDALELQRVMDIIDGVKEG